MTPEERAAETFQALLMSGTMMTKLSGDVKLCQIIAQAIREAEAARDERAAKIAEHIGHRMRLTRTECPCDEVGHDIAAAIRAPDTTHSS